jgi:hypothetical protein
MHVKLRLLDDRFSRIALEIGLGLNLAVTL